MPGQCQLKNWPLAINRAGHIVSFGELLLQHNSGALPFGTDQNGEPIVLPNYVQYPAGADFNAGAALACFGQKVFHIGRSAHDVRAVDLRRAMQRDAPSVDLTYYRDMPEGDASATPWFVLYNGCGIVQAQALMRRANSPLSHIDSSELQQSLMNDVRAVAPGAAVLIISTIVLGVNPQMLEFLTCRLIPEFKRQGALIALDLSYRSQQYASCGGIEEFRRRVRELVPCVDIVFHNFDYGCNDLGIDRDRYTDEMRERYPNVKVTLTAKRTALPDGTQRYQNLPWTFGTQLFDCMEFQVPCVHRVGCGDANFGAFLHYLLADRTPREAANFGAANGAAKMTMPGDVARTNLPMIETIVRQGGAVADVNR